MTATVQASNMYSEFVAQVDLLRERSIKAGENWIYSAGFNVMPDLANRARIDYELEDIEYIASAGGRVAILSHQGNYFDGTALHLNHIAAYIEQELGRPVEYVADADTTEAVKAARALRDGELAVVGNTRMCMGEQHNDLRLARRFAELGNYVAAGGFSKAHRSHASNVGVLEFRPGFAARSLEREVAALAPLAGANSRYYSVAAVGGMKREKIELGFESFARTYDLVVPGGAVLNLVLRELGYEIGGSTLGECGPHVKVVADVLARQNRAEIHVPSQVVVVPENRCTVDSARVVGISEGVPPDHAIVDFILEPWVIDKFAQNEGGLGRMVIAGTPSLVRKGFSRAADTLLELAITSGVETLLLGGDTVAELSWNGRVSTGGGAALHFLAKASCPLFESLARNKSRRTRL